MRQRGGRTVVRAAFAGLATLAAAHACRSGTPEGAERAWSVQLHLHGSASEGEGSYDSHAYEARDVGCDVLWWSDHDFRVTTYEHVTRFGFEGWEEPLARGESWSLRLRKQLGDGKRVQLLSRPEGAEARISPARSVEGERSLLLDTRSSAPAYEPLLLVLGADRKLQRRSLATGVTLRLAAFPEELAGDARIVVELQLSEHAPRDGVGLEPRVLRYEISAAPAGQTERAGPLARVPATCAPGAWNELVLPVTADAVRAFPESPGADNALYRIALGVEARAGGVARVHVDDLRIEQEHAGPPMLARQAELMREVAELHPGLRQLQGIEVSYGSRHLNLFCEDLPLPDYDALASECPRDPDRPDLVDQRAFGERVVEWVVAAVHERGGLVSYNHPFGVSFEENEKPRTNEEQLAILMRDRAAGADILEVGYRDRGGASLDDHLWLWDRAALAGLRLVGTGVSDSHGGRDNRWRGSPNNFVSWIWAPTPERPDLIAGLRGGRVFFGDLERFDGTLDLVLDSGERMGATVRGGPARREVTLLATGTSAGQRVVAVESGTRTATYAVEGTDARITHAFTVDGERPALVRFELHDGSGPVALTNPIHLVPHGGR